MYYQSKHFKVCELVPKSLYDVEGELSILVMDERILWTIDALRDKFGVPITVNNWSSGGSFSQRGFRNDTNVGAPLSQHRYGRACDFDIQGVTAEQFRAMVKAGELAAELQFITRIEETNAGKPISWVHVDCANYDKADYGIKFIQA